MRCPLTHCRAQMVERVDRLGRLSWDCPGCVRRKAGLCQRCPRPVAGTIGRARFCLECRAVRRKLTTEQWRKYNAERVLKSQRKYQRRNRRKHRAACKRWRENNREYNAERMRAYRWKKKGYAAPPKEKMSYAERGRIGGKLGAAARVKALGPDRVREIASKAGQARWDKHRARKAQEASCLPQSS